MGLFKNKLCYVLLLTLLAFILIPIMNAVASESNKLQTSVSSNSCVQSNEGKSVISTVYHSTNEDIEIKEIDILIEELATLVGKKQYDKFISLTSGDLNSSFSYLLTGPDSRQYKADNIGLWNIEDLKIIKYKQVPNSQVPSGSVNYEDYLSYHDVVTYYVSTDMIAKEDNIDMFSGINYFLWVFGKDREGKYKLLQWSQPM